jgi:hypothetical protein
MATEDYKNKQTSTYSDEDTENKKQQDPNQGIFDEVMRAFDKAREYFKNNYEDDYVDYWKCYNGIRTRRGYEGIADDFVPESFTIIESVKSNIAGGKPKFNFVPMSEEQKQDTEVLNNLVDFYWDQNRMTQKTLNWVQDMLVFGNGILMVSWEGNMPRIVNIPLFDWFVDPTATHMNNPEEPGYPKYAGYRYLTTKEELKKKQIVNPETGDMESLYTGIDDIEAMSQDWDDLDKDTKERYIGSTLGKDAHKEQIECIVYYSKDKKVVIANRNKVIYNGKNPYQRPERKEKRQVTMDGETTETEVTVPAIKSFLPFAILRDYVDTSLFYGKGDMAVIIDRQETLNDVSNQKQDNITYVLNNMWQIDPQFQHLVDTIESMPGAVYPIPQGALTPIEKQMVTGEADNEMLRIKDEMRRATAADEVVQGVSQEKGRVTATEVTAQLNQATQRFSTKLNTLESEGYAQLGRILFKMIQLFVTTDMAVRVMGPEGVVWKDFDPNEYSGEYEPKVELEATTKAIRAEEGQKYLQVHQVAANSPLVNQKEFLRVYFEKVLDLPEERIKQLLDVQQPMMDPMQVAMMAGQQQPQQSTNPFNVPSGPMQPAA